MSELSGYMYKVGDYVFTGNDSFPEGVIIAIREQLGNGEALVCENYFADTMLSLGYSVASIREANTCHWFNLANLMPDDDIEEE
jgi:hypothetical protein